MLTQVSADAVVQIVESVFGAMMELSVFEVEAPCLSSGDQLTSSVYFEGDRSGAVSLECTRRQACYFAGKLLSMEPPKGVDESVRDALGELANMIGGNLKAIIAKDASLSMPSVTEGHGCGLYISGCRTVDRFAFRFDGGDFVVKVCGQ